MTLLFLTFPLPRNRNWILEGGEVGPLGTRRRRHHIKSKTAERTVTEECNSAAIATALRLAKAPRHQEEHNLVLGCLFHIGNLVLRRSCERVECCVRLDAGGANRGHHTSESESEDRRSPNEA